MKIGVTGTRHGANVRQLSLIYDILKQVKQPSEFHHGDCIGVDNQTAHMALRLGFKIICHPPLIKTLRSYFPSHEYRLENSFLERNRNIVDETELLIVVPSEMTRQPRGGTWYTYDYAKRHGKHIQLILPIDPLSEF